MSISDLAALGSFVSSIAVLVSLGLLYFQLRQLTAQVRQADRFQQTLVKQARTSRLMEVNARVTDSDFAAALSRVTANGDDVTMLDWTRFNAHARAIFQNGEDTYSQHRRGLLHPDDYDGFVLSLEGSFRSAPLRVAWRQVRGAYPAPFTAFIDQIVAKMPPAAPRGDALERIKRSMAAESAAAHPPQPVPSAAP
ncbi:MAG TPA: hypothetical protein VGL58_09530 [Caulobacteraceae bacterium]|jgi:archaellum component FlaF (FlaF/FlaG flagellin family)